MAEIADPLPSNSCQRPASVNFQRSPNVNCPGVNRKTIRPRGSPPIRDHAVRVFINSERRGRLSRSRRLRFLGKPCPSTEIIAKDRRSAARAVEEHLQRETGPWGGSQPSWARIINIRPTHHPSKRGATQERDLAEAIGVSKANNILSSSKVPKKSGSARGTGKRKTGKQFQIERRARHDMEGHKQATSHRSTRGANPQTSKKPRQPQFAWFRQASTRGFVFFKEPL